MRSKRGGVHGCRQVRRPTALKELPPVDSHTERATQTLGIRGAETGDYFGFHYSDLRFEPRPAGVDLFRIRFLMDAALASLFPFEVLHRVSDMDFGSVEASLPERPRLPNVTSRAR